MLVKALKKHGYGGIMRRQGAEYHIENDKHVKLLVAVRAIRIISTQSEDQKVKVPTKRVEKKPELKKRTVKSKETLPEKKEKEIKKSKILKTRAEKKNLYSRKDMTAEENA